jgi:hypothetical protein
LVNSHIYNLFRPYNETGDQTALIATLQAFAATTNVIPIPNSIFSPLSTISYNFTGRIAAG